MKILIIGGDAAGMSVASKIARENKEMQIIVLEMTSEVSYGACGLPYYISGVNDNEDLLRIKKVQAFIENGIDVRLECKVTKVSFEKKSVIYVNDNCEFVESYDKLVIATGASPIRISLQGSHLENVHTLKTIDDANEIIASAQNCRNVVIVGAGYIGMECAETFLHLGKHVTIIERLPRILSTFDEDISEIAQKSILHHNIDIRLNCELKEIIGKTKVSSVVIDQKEVPADLVLLSVGIRPNTEFLIESGIKMHGNGAIVTNEYMESNIVDVYAAGDCATSINKLTNELQYVPLGTIANRQGKTLADIILGNRKKYNHSLANAALKLFEFECSRVGLDLEQAKKTFPKADHVLVEGYNHAPYYPNNSKVYLKLIFDRSSKILLGAQGFGKQNIVWRINALAIGIDQGITLEDLAIVDLNYAPPFSMPWDVIHNAANVALKRCL